MSQSMSISSKVKTFFKSMMVKPSPAAVFQAVKTLKPHTPMIKFRYGGGGAAGHSSAPSSPIAAASAGGGRVGATAPSTPLKPNASVQLPTIEDWQLPARYRRRPLDQVEIDYINRGGPE